MKKVLLTTTALVMTAGVAAAEVTMSGTAQVSIGAAGANDTELNTHIDFNVAVSGASDNGITMSTGFGYDAGNMVDGDHYDGAESGWGATTAAPELTIGYNGYTISAQQAGVADLYNGDISSGDLGIAGSMGGIDFAATANVGGGDDESSYKASYAMGDVTATLVGTNHADGDAVDATKVTLTYAMGDTTFTASSDDADDNDEAITSLGFSTVMDSITFAYTAKSTGASNSSVGDHWDASITYAAGALTASYALDEDDISEIKANYDLGGGTSLFAVMQNGENAAGDDKDFQAVGLNFTF